MFLKNAFSARRRGFSLTETAIVMGVAGAVLAGIWVAAGAVRSQQKSAQEVQQILTIAQKAKTFLYNIDLTTLPQGPSGTPAFTAAAPCLMTSLAKAGVFPPEMQSADALPNPPYPTFPNCATFYTPWGSVLAGGIKTFWGGAPMQSADPYAWELVIWQMSGTECAGVLSGLMSPGVKKLGLGHIYLDGLPGNAVFDPGTTSFSAVMAQGACSFGAQNMVISFIPTN